jgi:hypothetical protein
MDRLTRRIERLEAVKTEFIVRQMVHRRPAELHHKGEAEQVVLLRGTLERGRLIERYGRHHPAVRVLMARQGISDAYLDWEQAGVTAQRAGEDLDAWIDAHPVPKEDGSER